MHCTDASFSAVEKNLLTNVHRLHHRSMTVLENRQEFVKKTVQDIIDIMFTVKSLGNLSELSASSSFILVCATKNILSGIKYVDYIADCRIICKTNRDLIISSVRSLVDNYSKKTEGSMTADFKFEQLQSSIKDTLESLDPLNPEQFTCNVAQNQTHNAMLDEFTHAANRVSLHSFLRDLHEINKNLSRHSPTEIFHYLHSAITKHCQLMSDNLTRELTQSTLKLIGSILGYIWMISDPQHPLAGVLYSDAECVINFTFLLLEQKCRQESCSEDNEKLEEYCPSSLVGLNSTSSVTTTDFSQSVSDYPFIA